MVEKSGFWPFSLRGDGGCGRTNGWERASRWPSAGQRPLGHCHGGGLIENFESEDLDVVELLERPADLSGDPAHGSNFSRRRHVAGGSKGGVEIISRDDGFCEEGGERCDRGTIIGRLVVRNGKLDAVAGGEFVVMPHPP